MLQKIDDFLRQAPEGCLKWQKKGEKTYCYQQYKDDAFYANEFVKKMD